jgi:hypothetical protein
MSYQPLLVLYACMRLGREARFAEFPVRWGRVESSNVNPWAYGIRHLRRLVGMAFGRFPLRKVSLNAFVTDEVKWWEANACTELDRALH